MLCCGSTDNRFSTSRFRSLSVVVEALPGAATNIIRSQAAVQRPAMYCRVMALLSSCDKDTESRGPPTQWATRPATLLRFMSRASRAGFEPVLVNYREKKRIGGV